MKISYPGKIQFLSFKREDIKVFKTTSFSANRKLPSQHRIFFDKSFTCYVAFFAKFQSYCCSVKNTDKRYLLSLFWTVRKIFLFITCRLIRQTKWILSWCFIDVYTMNRVVLQVRLWKGSLIFSCSSQYPIRSLRSLSRLEHSQIKFISTRGHVTSPLYISHCSIFGRALPFFIILVVFSTNLETRCRLIIIALHCNIEPKLLHCYHLSSKVIHCFWSRYLRSYVFDETKQSVRITKVLRFQKICLWNQHGCDFGDSSVAVVMRCKNINLGFNIARHNYSSPITRKGKHMEVSSAIPPTLQNCSHHLST